MTYRITRADYYIVPDSYTEGEDPTREQYADLYITGEEFDSIDELLSYVASLFDENYSSDYWVLLPDSAGGKPSLQTDILVNEYERKASDEEIADWKNGEVELYNVHIFLIVEVFGESHLFSEDDAELAGIEIY